jgi:hypothetical protein
MIKKDFLKMIDEEFEDFEKEGKRERNLKLLIEFGTTSVVHNQKNIEFGKPKFKSKFKSSVYIKDKKNNNSLF